MQVIKEVNGSALARGRARRVSALVPIVGLVSERLDLLGITAAYSAFKSNSCVEAGHSAPR